jgi:TonB family protein
MLKKISTLVFVFALALSFANASFASEKKITTPKSPVAQEIAEKISYPDFAKRNHLEGTVGARVLIDATGTITQVMITSPSKYDLLNDAVKSVASQVISSEAAKETQDGKVLDLNIQFKLDEKNSFR